MEKRSRPRPRVLLTTAELKQWLKVSDWWVDERLKDPAFVEACVIDLAPEGSSRRNRRFDEAAVCELLGMTPSAAAPTG